MEQQATLKGKKNLLAQMPRVGPNKDESAEEFVKRRKVEVIASILEAGRGTRPWTIAELPSVAWKILMDKYPQETKGITEYDAVEEIKWHAYELVSENKFEVVGYPQDSCVLPLLKTIA